MRSEKWRGPLFEVWEREQGFFFRSNYYEKILSFLGFEGLPEVKTKFYDNETWILVVFYNILIFTIRVFRVSFLRQKKVIHDVRNDPLLQDFHQEPS